MTYLVKQYYPEEIPEDNRSYLKYTTNNMGEAIERAKFYGDCTEVWLRNEDYEETLIYPREDSDEKNSD